MERGTTIDKGNLRKEMHTGEIQELLSEWATMGVRSLILSGGEPTSHPDFAPILEHAHECKLSVGILSNGIWLDQGVANAIARCADWVRISVDGTLYLCLGQNDKLELRPLLRAGIPDDELKGLIIDAIARKPERHDFERKSSQVVRFMSMTGG